MNKVVKKISIVAMFFLFAWSGVASASDNTGSDHASNVKVQTASSMSLPLSSADARNAADDLMNANMPSPYSAQRVN